MDSKIYDLSERTLELSEKYSKIIVTYYDGHKKEFTPESWAIFERGVMKIAKRIKYIELNPKKKSILGIGKAFKKACENASDEFSKLKIALQRLKTYPKEKSKFHK